MRLIRRLFIITGFLFLLGSIIILLNFTAPNPTGRRYSSRPVLRQGSSGAVGNDGETVLAADLRLVSNNDGSQLVCFCKYGNTKTSSQCRSCAGQYNISSNRLPDFLTDRLIIDSKNVRDLGDYDQLSDFAIVARQTGRALWIYTRVDSTVAPKYHTLIESTGGKIVPYFTYAGYEDTADQWAKRGLLVSGLLFAGSFIRIKRPTVRIPVRPAKQPQTPLNKTAESIQRAQDHLDKSRDELN